MKMKEKARNILTFHGNSYFSLKIAQIIPFPAFLGELTSYLRKTIFILVQKIGIYANSPRNAGNGIICEILRDKYELP